MQPAVRQPAAATVALAVSRPVCGGGTVATPSGFVSSGSLTARQARSGRYSSTSARPRTACLPSRARNLSSRPDRPLSACSSRPSRSLPVACWPAESLACNTSNVTGAGNTAASRRRRSSSANGSACLRQACTGGYAVPYRCHPGAGDGNAMCPCSAVPISGTRRAGTAVAENRPARRRRLSFQPAVPAYRQNPPARHVPAAAPDCARKPDRVHAVLPDQTGVQSPASAAARHSPSVRTPICLNIFSVRGWPAQAFNRDRQQPVTQFIPGQQHAFDTGTGQPQ